MQKITPHLWFDKEAREAAEFYVSAFGLDSALTAVIPIKDTPSGDAELVAFSLLGYEFMAISAGPLFKVNPAVSFFVNFDPSQLADAEAQLTALWDKLRVGGKIFMPLASYPFSSQYGWVQDKYGVCWQLILSNPQGDMRPRIIPSLMFTQQVYGQAEAAMKFYTDIFENAKQGIIARYGEGHAPDHPNAVMYEDFRLSGQWFAAMDSARVPEAIFNEAVSLIINCNDQDDVDYYWEKLLGEGGSEGQCGWLKDPFGFSWQVTPTTMGDYVGGPDEAGRARALQAMYTMHKIDLAALKQAYEG